MTTVYDIEPESDVYIVFDGDGWPSIDEPPLRVLVASIDAVRRPGEKYVGLYDDDQVVRAILLLTPDGCYRRDQGYWVPLDPENDEADANIDKWDAYDTDPNVIPLWDSAQRSDGSMVLSDLFVG